MTTEELLELLESSRVSYVDKISAWKKIAQLPEIVRFGLLCAESVLDIYEREYPTDNRPRLAIEAAKQYPNTTDAADAAYAAADAANAAYAAADAAYAAANAANDAHAAYAAAYAVDAAADKVTQQQKNIGILISLYGPSKPKVWSVRGRITKATTKFR